MLSRYGLFKETVRGFLQNLCKQKPGLYESVAKELSIDSLAKDFDLTEKDREKAQRQIRVMAEDRLKERCPVKIGANVATLTLDERSYAGAARYHKYMEDPGYRKKCSIRADAETIVSEIVQGHGVRKSRHRDEVRTRLQLIFSAIACNVKRYIRHGQEYAYCYSDKYVKT